jgi:hypothetical protein
MPDCFVCPLGGNAKAMSFAEFFRRFPHRLVPEAWEALAIAAMTDQIIEFRDDRHDPMKAVSTNFVTTNPTVPDGAPYWSISARTLKLATARTLLHQPQARVVTPTKLLTDDRGPKTTYRLGLRASVTVDSDVLVDAHSPDDAIALFEASPDRYHGEAMDVLENSWDWHELTPMQWIVVSAIPTDD